MPYAPQGVKGFDDDDDDDVRFLLIPDNELSPLYRSQKQTLALICSERVTPHMRVA